MKRYLLFLLMCVCASVGAWAAPIGSTQSTYEVTTTERNGKTVLTINLAAANDLSTSGWVVQNGFGSEAPDNFKSADCVVISGPIGSDDAQLIHNFNYTLLNLYGATLASGVTGSSVSVHDPTAGIIVPQGMTAAQWLSNSNPYQYKTLFSIDETSGIVTADIYSADNNFATIMTDERQDYHFFGNNNENDSEGCSTLVINKIGAEYVNYQPTGNYVESGVTLTSDIVNGINAANSDFTAINVENASASNLSVVITNTHVNTLNLSGLNLSGEVTLDIGGDDTNAANMKLQSLNLSDLTVKTVDASQVATLTNVNLAGANITSVDFTRTSGGYSDLYVTVSGPDLVGKFTPTAQTMWGNDEEAHVSKPAVVYSATDMHLHDGHVGITGDNSDFKNYVFWYQGDNDPTGIATLNAKGSISGILTSEAYDHNKTFTKVKIDGYLSKTELDNLGNISATVLDLSDLDLTHEGACSVADLSEQFCKTNWDLNPNVKFVILPEGVSREQILSADRVSGLKNVYSLVSFTHDGDKFDFTAYNRVSGTLAPALVAGGKGVVNSYMQYDGHNAYTPEMTPNNKKSATISGHINAYDLTAGEVNLDANGHLAFNKIYADESLGVDDRVNVGTVKPYGGLSGNTSGPETLDLKYAEIDGPQYINDIKISSLIHNYGPLKYLIIPETESVKETPSFFITHNDIKEICIPSNIEVIRTHFAPSVDHIWTTGYKVGQAGGDPAGLRYDNGCYNSKADENNPEMPPSYGYTDLSFSASSLYPFGTYTFSSNLKMIETGAFANTNPCVKDVYVLAKKAPECHVDAFNTKMYVGNGGYSPKIENGVITRDSYVNGSQWITMLHYPRECTSPEVQRYTDPTRQYSIASNEVDGKGGVLYYPSQGEFIAAYAQGTTGYLWNAWDRTYEWGMLKSSANITDAWSIANQQKANGYFLANPDLTEYPGDTKYTCTSFYDVTADGRLEQPAGLVPYYDVRWNERVLSDKGDGIQLYPAIGVDNTTKEYRYVVATEQDFANNIKVYTLNSSGGYDVYAGSYNAGTTYYKRVQTQETNEDGSPKFETCDNGSYVQATRYVEAENGGFVRERTVSSYAQTDKPIEGIDTYYSDDQGEMAVTPKVGGEFYYQDGMKNVYNEVYYPVKVNGQLVTEYYKKNGDNYEPSPMEFSTTKYHSPVVSHQTKYTGTYVMKFGVSHYYRDSKGLNEVTTPTISYSGTLYYKDATDGKYHLTDKFVPGQSDYYVKFDYSDYLPINDNYPQVSFNGSQYYYANGEEDATTYSSTDVWLPSITTYYSDENGTVYYTDDGSTPWPGGAFNSAYYYVTGESPNIVTAQNTPYNSTRTYYTDAAGTTEATEVTFDKSYFYPVYNDTYRAYTTADGNAKQYKKETYYREATTDDGSAQRYCPVMKDVEFNPVTVKNDYRGWHQFVLNAYAKNTDIPLQPSRSYQTDNDWWTICLPYDLTYNEVMLFYGDVNESGEADASKVPVVCLLSNVVRDPAKKHIRLNFSSNLMEHKATKTGGEWKVSDEAPNHDVSRDADVIIHAGVPYAIKPMFKPNAGRQFDVYGQTSVNADISAGRITATSDKYPGLYEKLKAAENIAGADFRAMQEDNLYTVPCLIPADQAKADEVVNEPVITYDGVDYKRSNSLDYTFVGALQRNLIPPFSYFMGYKNTSLFVYADYDTQEFEDNKKETTPDYRNTYKWTNNACVICPNLLSESCKSTQKGENNKYNLMKGSHKGLVAEATSSAPARWEILNKVATIGGMSILTDDRFADTGAPSRGIFGLGDEIHYGNDMKYAVVDGVESVETGEEAVSRADRKVYSINGQYMGDSRQSLKKGIYIIGGKKYVVK